MSENRYKRQNILREILDLKKRNPAEFNVFVDEKGIVETLEKNGLKLEALKNIGSVHDIILYVLLPKLTGHSDNYNHPLVELAKNLELNYQNEFKENCFGDFGQVK